MTCSTRCSRSFARLGPAALEARFAAAGLGFPSRVIDLAAMGVQVVGGSTRPFAGRPATLVLYRLPGSRMLCRMVRDDEQSSIVPARTPALQERGFAFVTATRGGASFVFWREGPVACVLVARLPEAKLLAFAREKAMAAAP
jgi:anti-sigma factor RsiW